MSRALPSYALITLDSCRHDVFVGARAPAMTGRGSVLEALTPASFTFPAHLSMFQGMTPDCRHPFPIYNRFVMQLWRCPLLRDGGAGGAEGAEPSVFCRVPGGSKNVPLGLSAMGSGGER